jgi:hypothetical protein
MINHENGRDIENTEVSGIVTCPIYMQKIEKNNGKARDYPNCVRCITF